MAGKKNATPEQKVEEPELFSKSQLVQSSKYRDKRDLVDALLVDGKKYTLEQVDNMIENFMKGKVN